MLLNKRHRAEPTSKLAQCTSWYSPSSFPFVFLARRPPLSWYSRIRAAKWGTLEILQADNGRQLLPLHKSFMSWISCTSLFFFPFLLPSPHACLPGSEPISRHSKNTSRRAYEETKHDRGFVWQVSDCILQKQPNTYCVPIVGRHIKSSGDC